MTPVILRRRPPYHCRFTVAGKMCLSVLAEDDTDECKPHQEARERFMTAPVRPVRAEVSSAPVRRIWPEGL